ncbi:MAG: hypothetical protein QN183_14095 [Armatimonadota bacterium]|nr:hypothetical protein [Armatimonadota bacterium]MDR7534054.1 hypothetical protein [Armatimonadota bacterium]MDR7537482.1 hypothetical protein [Armatimonadota bacterium]
MVVLYQLQQIDSAIAQAGVQRAGLDDGTAARADVAAAEAHVTQLTERLGHTRARARDVELEVAALEAKRARVEADLYSGRVRNPKELAAMLDEVAQLARQKDRLEDELLNLLSDIDRLEPAQRDARRRLEDAQRTLGARLEAYRAAVADLDARLTSLEARRAALCEHVEETVRRRYDRLRQAKGGIAVVAIRDGICEGCHVVVPERLVVRLQDDPELLATCDGCGRLLVVPPAP